MEKKYAKTPPQAIELEQSVLGAILIEKDALLDVIDILTVESFYKEKHQRVFQAMLQLNSDSNPIDILTVTEQLKKSGDLDFIGGPYFITELTFRVSSAANIEYHARIVEQKKIARDVINMASGLLEDAYDDTQDILEVTERMITDSYNIGDIKKGNIHQSNTELLRKLKTKIELAKQLEGITGIRTGILSQDKILRGYQDTNLYILAARTAMGKTSKALCEAAFIANEDKHNVLFFSIEMSAEQLMERMVSIETEISLNKLQTGNMSDPDWKRYNEVTSKMMNEHLQIIDKAGISLNEVRKIAKKHALKKGLDIIFIDYLQLMKDPVKGNYNREQEISRISSGLKELAKELNIPIIALAQLSRAVETRGGDKRPILSDLRESGCLVGGSLIHTNTGIVKIKELEEIKDFKLYSHNDKIVNNKAKKCWKTGNKEILEMNLTTGHSIKATGNHKFLTENGWKKLSEISEKEKVAIPLNYSNNNTDYNEYVAYLMGAFISNGKLLKRQAVTYTCNTKDIFLAETVKKIIDDNFECISRIKDNGPKYNWINVYCKSKQHVSRYHRNPFVKFMDEQEVYNKKAENKIAPPSIFIQEKDIILNFLAGLYDNDGSIHLVYSKKRTIPSISYSTASHQLALEVQVLLQMIGIISRIKKLSNKKGSTWYSISISSKENILLFCNSVPLKSKRKKEEIEKIKNHLKNIRGGWKKYFINDNKSLGFVEVKEILKAKTKQDVYDIEVPNSHNFIANGILAHNSIEQDADVVQFIYRPEYYGLTEDADGNSTIGRADFIIAKNRHGATKTVYAKFIAHLTKFEDLGKEEEFKSFDDPEDFPTTPINVDFDSEGPEKPVKFVRDPTEGNQRDGEL